MPVIAPIPDGVYKGNSIVNQQGQDQNDPG